MGYRCLRLMELFERMVNRRSTCCGHQPADICVPEATLIRSRCIVEVVESIASDMCIEHLQPPGHVFKLDTVVGSCMRTCKVAIALSKEDCLYHVDHPCTMGFKLTPISK